MQNGTMMVPVVAPPAGVPPTADSTATHAHGFPQYAAAPYQAYAAVDATQAGAMTMPGGAPPVGDLASIDLGSILVAAGEGPPEAAAGGDAYGPNAALPEDDDEKEGAFLNVLASLRGG